MNLLLTQILWTLKLSQLHFSFRSCGGINKLFPVMFPDGEISFNLKPGKTKCVYLMNYGNAPHFKTNLLRSINNSSFYSLSFDESLNNVLQSFQMDINICYWNEAKNFVGTRYLDSKFVSRPNDPGLHNVNSPLVFEIVSILQQLSTFIDE